MPARGALECCGILGGVAPRVGSIHPLRNIAASEQRYLADPQEHIQAHVWLRQRQWETLAIYHSHPRWEAVPSRTDLEQNHWGDMPRIIVSLLSSPPVVRIWRLGSDSFHELAWTLVPPAETISAALQTPPADD